MDPQAFRLLTDHLARQDDAIDGIRTDVAHLSETMDTRLKNLELPQAIQVAHAKTRAKWTDRLITGVCTLLGAGALGWLLHLI